MVSNRAMIWVIPGFPRPKTAQVPGTCDRFAAKSQVPGTCG